MENFLLIGICVIAGMLFSRSKVLPADAHKGINAWIINLALPAVSLRYLSHIHWSKELILPATTPLAVWLGSWLLIRLYAIMQKIPKATEGGLKLATGLSNTTFIGFPLIVAYYSEKELGIAIIYDQLNFMILATAGIIVAVHSAKKEALSIAVIARRLLKFPPFLGCMAALILPNFVDITPLDPLFTKMAGTVGPLALFSIGLQLKFKGWQNHIKYISAALLYKLIIAPLLVFGIVLLSGIKGTIGQISVFESAMPTLITAGIIAEEYDLDPTLVNLIIGIGIVISFITTGVWWLVLEFLK
ncbi:MAG: AEC family transporter [Ferruginibacter sp.]